MRIVFAAILMLSLGGCVPAMIAAAGVGYMVADEMAEMDGVMDPLEKLRGKENADPAAEREIYRAGNAWSRIETYQRGVIERAQARLDTYEAIRN